MNAKTSVFVICVICEYLLLLPQIKAAEIVECAHKYMDRSSQNLQRLSSY